MANESDVYLFILSLLKRNQPQFTCGLRFHLLLHSERTNKNHMNGSRKSLLLPFCFSLWRVIMSNYSCSLERKLILNVLDSHLMASTLFHAQWMESLKWVFLSNLSSHVSYFCEVWLKFTNIFRSGIILVGSLKRIFNIKLM
jgi:hypothetical protein